jgi:hypothetical protein
MIAAAWLLLFSGAAAAFPLDLDFDPAGLDVIATPATDGRSAMVRVLNGEDFAVRCRAVFRNGPEVGRARQVIVAPGQPATLSWTPTRSVVRMRIELHCERDGEASRT